MDKIYPEEHIQAIANAIRRKNGKSVNYLTSEMAGAIDQLVSYPEPTGTQTITENGIVDVKDKQYADVNVQASATLISKTITANGEYDAEDDEADGYSDVTVDVPNSYSASDEGKVVSSGALVAQTSTTKTANGTYDTTENNEVVVAVPQPSGNINITDMQSTDVSAYATAQVVDADLVAGNIKKDVDILGVVGTYEGSGGGSTLITKTITQNGTYDAEDDNADGYSEVTVNVSGGGGRLPSEYEEVLCIQGDGTGTYIDSGIVPTENTVIKAVVACRATRGASYLNQVLFGSRKNGSVSDTTASMFEFWHYAENSSSARYRKFRCDYGYHNNNVYTSPTDVTFAEIEFGKEYLIMNGDTYTWSGDDINSNTYSVYIGATNSGGSVTAYSLASFFSMQIYSGTTLLKDFVPCVRKSDGEAGLYDLVGNSFYSSIGSTSFTAVRNLS